MKSEGYYIVRDSALNEVNSVCSIMDNQSIDDINRITIDIMFELNKWRKKNGLALMTTLVEK